LIALNDWQHLTQLSYTFSGTEALAAISRLHNFLCLSYPSLRTCLS